MRRNCAVVVFTKLKGRLLHLTRLRSLEYSWISRNLNYSPCPLFKNRREFCVLLVFQCCLSSHMSSGVVWWKHHWPDLFKHDHNALLLWNDSVLALLACFQVGSAGNWAVIWSPAQLREHLLSLFAGPQDDVWLAGGLFPPSNLPPPLMTLFPLDFVLSPSCWGGGLQDLASDTFP